MSNRTITPKPEHEVAYQDIIKLVHRHTHSLSAIELFAVAANMLGKLAALQDQRVTSEKIVIETLMENFQLGNKQVIDELRNKTGGSA